MNVQPVLNKNEVIQFKLDNHYIENAEDNVCGMVCGY